MNEAVCVVLEPFIAIRIYVYKHGQCNVIRKYIQFWDDDGAARCSIAQNSWQQCEKKRDQRICEYKYMVSGDGSSTFAFMCNGLMCYLPAPISFDAAQSPCWSNRCCCHAQQSALWKYMLAAIYKIYIGWIAVSPEACHTIFVIELFLARWSSFNSMDFYAPKLH